MVGQRQKQEGHLEAIVISRWKMMVARSRVVAMVVVRSGQILIQFVSITIRCLDRFDVDVGEREKKSSLTPKFSVQQLEGQS